MTLVITHENMMMFEQLAKKRFIEELTLYCQSSFPEWLNSINEENLTNIIQWLIDNSKDRGIEQRYSLYLLLYISLMLGGLFFEDSQYEELETGFEWNSYLENEHIKNLHQNITYYIEHVVGDENILLETAFKHLGKLESFHINKDTFTSDMLIILKQLYPEKINFLGQEMYQQFIEKGKKRAEEVYALKQINQQATFIILQFFLGQHFDDDPFVSWFDWLEHLQEIRHNHFEFRSLADQLQRIYRSEKENDNGNT